MNATMAFIVALVSSTGIWGVMQFILNRTGRKAEIARQLAETEKIKDEVENNNRKILAAAQIAAQQAALESSDKRYNELRGDYDHQRVAHNDLRAAIEELIEIVERLATRMAPSGDGDRAIIITVTQREYRATRAALRAVRTHLW